MARPAGLFLTLLLALFFFLPASCLAADQAAEPAPNSSTDAVPKAVIDPDMDEGHRQFAHANYEKALEHYLKALARNKEDAYLYFRIGLTYYMLYNMENAHAYWLKSYDFDPDLADGFATKVLGEEMSPTLLPGDIFTTDDQHYNYINLEYKDVVKYNSPDENNSVLVNRIVGLPNDYIELVDNALIRNNVYIKEGYTNNNSKSISHGSSNMGKIYIPNSCIFVLGDNRAVSYDSRNHGCIDKSSILGKPLIINESIEGDGGKQHVREDRYGLVIE